MTTDDVAQSADSASGHEDGIHPPPDGMVPHPVRGQGRARSGPLLDSQPGVTAIAGGLLATATAR